MADKEIATLTAATTPTGAELGKIVQGGNSRKTTLAVLGHQFRGARARKTSDQTTVNTTAGTTISFDAAQFDTDSFWSAGAPTRLTIPASAGFKYVEVFASIRINLANADTFRSLTLQHLNSGAVAQGNWGSSAEIGTTTHYLTVSSGPVVVADGDYFHMIHTEESDTSVTIVGSLNQTSLSLTVVGMEPV